MSLPEDVVGIYNYVPNESNERLAKRWHKYLIFDDGCIMWSGYRDANGYAKLNRVDGKSAMAHRTGFELYNGEIPPGKVIDHLCRNPGCVRPDHMRMTDQSTNTREGLQGFDLTGMCRALLHDVTQPGAIYVRPNGDRRCVQCIKILHEKRKAKWRAKNG